MNSRVTDTIREARQNKECAYINTEKLKIICSSKALRDTEKLIWIFLSGEASKN